MGFGPPFRAFHRRGARLIGSARDGNGMPSASRPGKDPPPPYGSRRSTAALFGSPSPSAHDPPRPAALAPGASCLAPGPSAATTSHGVPFPFSTFQSNEASGPRPLSSRPSSNRAGLPTPAGVRLWRSNAFDVLLLARPGLGPPPDRDSAPGVRPFRAFPSPEKDCASRRVFPSCGFRPRDQGLHRYLQALRPFGNQRGALPISDGPLQGVAPPGDVASGAPAHAGRTEHISLEVSALRGLSCRAAANASIRLLPRASAGVTNKGGFRGRNSP